MWFATVRLNLNWQYYNTSVFLTKNHSLINPPLFALVTSSSNDVFTLIGRQLTPDSVYICVCMFKVHKSSRCWYNIVYCDFHKLILGKIGLLSVVSRSRFAAPKNSLTIIAAGANWSMCVCQLIEKQFGKINVDSIIYKHHIACVVWQTHTTHDTWIHLWGPRPWPTKNQLWNTSKWCLTIGVRPSALLNWHRQYFVHR